MACRIISTIFITNYHILSNLLGFFYRIKHNLNFEMAKIVYCAFVHSHLIYALKFMETHKYKKHSNTLMILSNKILRLLQKAPISQSYPISQLYTNFSTMPLPDLHKFQILKFVSK